MRPEADPEKEDTYKLERRRGQEAEQLLSNELFLAAFVAVRKELEAVIWDNSSTDVLILAAVGAGKLLGRLEFNIREHIDTGKFGKASLDLLEESK